MRYYTGSGQGFYPPLQGTVDAAERLYLKCCCLLSTLAAVADAAVWASLTGTGAEGSDGGNPGASRRSGPSDAQPPLRSSRLQHAHL